MALQPVRRWNTESDEAGANRQTASLAGLAVSLVIVVICLMLVHMLQRECSVEDCLLSGRTNCGESIPLQGH